MAMLGFDAVGKLALGQLPAAASTVSFGWFEPLTEPVRFRPVLPATQQFLALAPKPVVPFAWFEALAELRMSRPRSPAALAPSYFYQPAPSPFVATGWYANLSLPVRLKPRLDAARHQFVAYQPNPTTITPFAWFGNLSDPVRIKPGLRAALQQYLAHPPQLRPTPTSFAVLNATETKDVFLGGVTDWNRINSGEVGLVIITAPAGEVGLISANTASPIASAVVSISIV